MNHQQNHGGLQRQILATGPSEVRSFRFGLGASAGASLRRAATKRSNIARSEKNHLCKNRTFPDTSVQTVLSGFLPTARDFGMLSPLMLVLWRNPEVSSSGLDALPLREPFGKPEQSRKQKEPLPGPSKTQRQQKSIQRWVLPGIAASIDRAKPSGLQQIIQRLVLLGFAWFCSVLLWWTARSCYGTLGFARCQTSIELKLTNQQRHHEGEPAQTKPDISVQDYSMLKRTTHPPAGSTLRFMCLIAAKPRPEFQCPEIFHLQS